MQDDKETEIDTLHRRHFTLMLGLGLFAGSFAAPFAANAQPAAWPSGPIHLVVPFAAGSSPDSVARLLGERLAVRLGKPVIVDNKAGAAGNLGTDLVAKAAPDGLTLGISIAGPLAVNSLLFKKLPYDPAKDIAPISIVVTQPAILVVGSQPGSPRNAAELLQAIKQNPGKYSFSSMGAGTVSHLALQALSMQSGADLVHVPYSGSSAAATAIISGDVTMAALPAATVMPLVKAGRLHALASVSAKRSPLVPDLPTLAELGIADIQADAWMGFIAPARTPPAIVSRLHDELVQILAEPAMKEKLRLQYMDPVADTPAEFKSVLAADVARWKPVIQKLNITLD